MLSRLMYQVLTCFLIGCRYEVIVILDYMSRHSTGCCTVSLVGWFSVLIVNLRWADRCLFVLGNCWLHAWWKLKFKATVFIAFVIVLLLSYVEFVNTIICCFIWLCMLLVLLILPQDPNNWNSAAQTIEDGVRASPRITSLWVQTRPKLSDF